MSPNAWKNSFSEFHRNYNPRSSQRSSLRSPEKPRHGTLTRGSGSITGSSHQSILVSPGPRDPGSPGLSEMPSPSADAKRAEETTGGDSKQVEERRSVKEECEASAGGGEKALASESSSEENISCDSESLQLSAGADSSTLHIEESDDSPEDLGSPKENGLGNGKLSGMEDQSTPQKVCVLRSSQPVRTSSVFQ